MLNLYYFIYLYTCDCRKLFLMKRGHKREGFRCPDMPFPACCEIYCMMLIQRWTCLIMYFSDHSALDKQCVAVALLSALSSQFGMQARAAVAHTALSPGCCLGDGVGAGSLLLATNSRLRGVFPCVLSPAAACTQREKLFRISSLDPFTSLELPRGKLTSSPEMSVQRMLLAGNLPAQRTFLHGYIREG